MRLHTEKKYKIKIRVGHWLLDWIVRLGGWLHNQFQLKGDGKTVDCHFTGHAYRGFIREFFECMLYHKPEIKDAKMDSRWGQGVWVGKSHRSDEHLLCSIHGVVKATSIK